MDTNEVTLSGKLTRDPQLKVTRNGTAICSFRVACNKMFFNVKIWGDTGRELATNLSKGAVIQVVGRLDWHEWNPDNGPRREYVEIIAGEDPHSVTVMHSGGFGSDQVPNGLAGPGGGLASNTAATMQGGEQSYTPNIGMPDPGVEMGVDHSSVDLGVGNVAMGVPPQGVAVGVGVPNAMVDPNASIAPLGAGAVDPYGNGAIPNAPANPNPTNGAFPSGMQAPQSNGAPPPPSAPVAPPVNNALAPPPVQSVAANVPPANFQANGGAVAPAPIGEPPQVNVNVGVPSVAVNAGIADQPVPAAIEEPPPGVDPGNLEPPAELSDPESEVIEEDNRFM
jgi:single-strand DNA-binding protein